jgi:hypothetical protein
MFNVHVNIETVGTLKSLCTLAIVKRGSFVSLIRRNCSVLVLEIS